MLIYTLHAISMLTYIARARRTMCNPPATRYASIGVDFPQRPYEVWGQKLVGFEKFQQFQIYTLHAISILTYTAQARCSQLTQHRFAHAFVPIFNRRHKLLGANTLVRVDKVQHLLSYALHVIAILTYAAKGARNHPTYVALVCVYVFTCGGIHRNQTSI
jgi:hypothetical protein